MKLSTFQDYLTSKAPLPSAPKPRLDDSFQERLKWAASLSMLPEDEQLEEISAALSELHGSLIDDALRLQLMDIVIGAANRLIASLRSHYIHESGSLNAHQLMVAEKIKSLYQQMLPIFDDVIDRNCHDPVKTAEAPAKRANPKVWSWMKQNSEEIRPQVLACAIYHALVVHQKLHYELALCYQKVPNTSWKTIHELYALGCRFEVTHVNLSVCMVTKTAINIHQLYCQICLHSLLNVLAMRRPSMLLVQRLLPEWASHITASFSPQSATRIFVDLNSNQPPEYVSAAKGINPYADGHWCLFIELEPLANYLRLRQNTLLVMNTDLTEYRLVTKILMAITHRYLERSLKSTAKYSPKSRATIVTQFNAIHYHAAGKQALMDLIALHELSLDYLPQYDTEPKKGAAPSSFEVEMLDNQGALTHFRTLRLLTVQDVAAFEQLISKKDQSQAVKSPIIPPLNQIFEPISLEEAKTESAEVLSEFLATAPPHLQIMNLFLISGHLPSNKGQLSSTQQSSQQSAKQSSNQKSALGLVRWLNLEDEFIETEAQILGHSPTACALRLDERDNRNQAFVPALLLAAEESLGTNCSLLVPSYHFKSGDKVVIRLNNKQKALRLQHCILSTEEFAQFEVTRL